MAETPSWPQRVDTEAIGDGSTDRREAVGQPATGRIGPYEIRSVLGKGGMGMVYRARVVAPSPIPMGRDIAIKMLTSEDLDSHDRRRFEREAAYLQALRHHGIVRILDIGEHEGRPFIAMELVEGRSLDEILDAQVRAIGERRVDPATAARYTVQALEALHTAHLAGILHRDLKPGNIMVDDDGRVQVLDFGMARRITGDSHLTQSGAILGTPAYMSPEQATGVREMLSPRSDVYGMGAVLYELVTGRQPFTADSAVGVIRMVIDHPLEAPSRFVPSLPRDLETVILTAMARDPADRYRNAEAMATDLRRFLEGQRVRARRRGMLRQTLRQAYRRRRTLASVLLAIFMVVATIVLSVRWMLERTEQETAERFEEDIRNLTEQQQPAWKDAWALTDRAEWQQLVDAGRPYPLSPDMTAVNLPAVTGNVRLAVEFAPTRGNAAIELMVSQRDVGDGYALRAEAATSGWFLQLLRGREGGTAARVAVAEYELAEYRALDLLLERENGVIAARIDGETVMEFTDPAPIEGPEHDDVIVALRPDTIQVVKVDLDRQRVPRQVSSLARFDSLRQSGRYQQAMSHYREFLNDHPDSPEANAARYRIGLCQAAIGDHDDALETFSALAREEDLDERFFAAVTFQAWVNALALGRYDTAERHFDTIRNRFELPQLLASVPIDQLEALPDDYIRRARDLSAIFPDRALMLYRNAADIAAFLGRWNQVAIAVLGRGDLVLASGRIAVAIDEFRMVLDDTRIPDHQRQLARLKIAEAERLRRNYAEAMAIYEDVLRTATGDIAQWARLWYGDILLTLGERERAISTWAGSIESDSVPGQLMNHLRGGTTPLEIEVAEHYRNDVDYFNAVLANLNNDHEAYWILMDSVARGGPAHDWPTHLARQAIDRR